MTEMFALGEHCVKIGSGATPRGGKEFYLSEGPFALIRSQNVHNDGFSRDGLAWISDEQAALLRNVEVNEGDVLVNITGDSVARVCQVDAGILPARVNQHVAIIRPNQVTLDATFLRYWLVSANMQSRLLALASAGATRNALTKSMLEGLPVRKMELEQQRAIANVLSTLDYKIELNRRMNATLEAMAQAIFRDWFVDFGPVRRKMAGATDRIAILGTLIPNPTQAASLAALFPDALGDDSLPMGWNNSRLTDLMDIQGGTQPPKSEFVYEPTDGYVRLLQIRDFDHENYPTYVKDRKALKKMATYDTAIGRYGAAVGRICWGRSGAYNVALAKVVPNQAMDDEFLRCVVKSAEFQSYLIAISGRSAQAGFNKNDLAGFSLCSASEPARTAFWKLVRPMREKQIQAQEENKTLAETRDYLLPRLMSGKVRVADAEKAVA